MVERIWGLGPSVQIGEEVLVLEGEVSNTPCNPGGRGEGRFSLDDRLGPGLSGAPGEQCSPDLSGEGPRAPARVEERVSVPPGGHGAVWGEAGAGPGPASPV